MILTPKRSIILLVGVSTYHRGIHGTEFFYRGKATHINMFVINVGVPTWRKKCQNKGACVCTAPQEKYEIL